MSGNILFLGNKIFEIPPFFQTRPGDLSEKVHACSLRFSALKPQTNVYCLISYRAGAWHYPIFLDFSKSLVSKWRIVRVKTRTKAFFLEEILINIPSENLPKLSKERMQYFCHALKLNFSMNRSARTEDDYKQCINFTQQRILCLILPASVK